MAKGYQLGIEAVRQIRLLIRKDRMEADKRTRSRQQHSAPGQAIYIAKTGAGGIAALSGTTPGTATVTLQYIDADGDVQELKDASNDAVTVTAVNMSSGAVAANTYIQLKQESISGRLLADFEDCG